MTIHRVTAQWSGFTGAPGYSNFYFLAGVGTPDQDQETSRVHGFFSDLTTILPSQVSIQVDSTVEVVDEVTGTLEDYVEAEPLPPVTSSGSDSSYAGPAGMVVNWLTNTVNNGRRVRGRTFLVPINSNLFEADGTIGSGSLQIVRDAANDFIQDEWNSSLCVWSRPRNGAGGLAAPVTGSRVPDLAAVLRSRRD